jgi:hypothetical protein
MRGRQSKRDSRMIEKPEYIKNRLKTIKHSDWPIFHNKIANREVNLAREGISNFDARSLQWSIAPWVDLKMGCVLHKIISQVVNLIC